jgi:hypothetical protein
VLAYVFWHRPRNPDAVEAYEHAQIAFHRSLAHSRPVGMCASAAFRLAEIPWLPAAAGASGAGYEDWYLLEDFAALGVLNEAAVGHGHRTSHDDVAHRYGDGTASLYGLIEGDYRADLLEAASVAAWVARPPGGSKAMLGELLGDGIDPGHASLWRRHLVLGPAPEYCLLTADRSRLEGASGVAQARLPEGWSATVLEREVLWNG